jgi:hypothetical protein
LITSLIIILRDVPQGIWYLIPPCCIARYVHDILRGHFPATERGVRRGIKTVYVPCGIFHQADYTLQQYSELEEV